MSSIPTSSFAGFPFRKDERAKPSNKTSALSLAFVCSFAVV